MGLTIALEGERGDRISSVDDPENFLHRLLPAPEDPSFRCLSYVDLYGDTVFNRLQMPTVLKLEDLPS